MNNEPKPSSDKQIHPVPTHTRGVANFLGFLLHFFSLSITLLLQRQMILIQDKSHWSRLTSGPLFCAFFCIRKAKEFLSLHFSVKEEGSWLKRTHCVSFVTSDILRGKGSTRLSKEVKEKWYWRVEYLVGCWLLWLATELWAPSCLVTWLMEWSEPNNTMWNEGTLAFVFLIVPPTCHTGTSNTVHS